MRSGTSVPRGSANARSKPDASRTLLEAALRRVPRSTWIRDLAARDHLRTPSQNSRQPSRSLPPERMYASQNESYSTEKGSGRTLSDGNKVRTVLPVSAPRSCFTAIGLGAACAPWTALTSGSPRGPHMNVAATHFATCISHCVSSLAKFCSSSKHGNKKPGIHHQQRFGYQC